MCWNLSTLKYIIIGALYLLIITSCSGGGGGASTDNGSGSGGSSTITLTWKAPTQYTDGSSLNPISGMYTQTVNYIPQSGSTTVSEMISLTPGTYYFVVTATDTLGYESAASSEMRKTI
jgi:hypothetical protein